MHARYMLRTADAVRRNKKTSFGCTSGGERLGKKKPVRSPPNGEKSVSRRAYRSHAQYVCTYYSRSMYALHIALQNSAFVVDDRPPSPVMALRSEGGGSGWF